MFARLGGDEFAIIAPGLSLPATAGRIAETILEALQSAPCSRKPTPRSTVPKMKQGTYRYFDASMGAALHERRLLEHDLHNAISCGELRLVYQPEKSIRAGKVVGFEALLRWKHPTRGEVSPAEFIPIAEDTGLILQIGEWVLRSACREAASWTINRRGKCIGRANP